MYIHQNLKMKMLHRKINVDFNTGQDSYRSLIPAF